MPERCLVDASVVAKWFNKGENFEQEATALRTAWVEAKIKLLSPSLVVYEVCNSIWKNPNIDQERASALSKLVVRLAPKLLEIRETEASEIMNLGRQHKVTFYDATYIILSSYEKCPLVSADDDQLEVARGYTETVHISKVRNLLRT